MKRCLQVPGLLAAAALLLAATVARGEEPPAKHHHDLRGVINKVAPEKNEFEIKTDAGRVVLCLIDSKTALRRGEKKVDLKDVRPGERARCHCAAIRDGKHYSQSLLLEPSKEKEEK